ncbi:GerMN domain-containing protein [Gudongella sp. DL1XJH-153]|uniref:GerMN domain-containing protein n=1 Tax=Gudongella sp. DL1XJH-153 TaxID=3409804 RepID=UPI003BB724D9
MKKFIILIFALVLAVGLAACGGSQEPEEPQEPPVVEEPSQEPEEPEEPEEKTAEVVLYFANNEYVETGDEQYEWMLTETQTIIYDDEICLEEAIVRALIAGPEDEENLSTGFPETVELIGVEVMDGTAYVNFEGEGLNGGSMQESYIISQTVESLGELGSVQRIQFLVDSQEAESLMGHISIEDPIEVTMD